jgi:hypothetical protein
LGGALAASAEGLKPKRHNVPARTGLKRLPLHANMGSLLLKVLRRVVRGVGSIVALIRKS